MKYIWSTKDASGKLLEYAILECSSEVADEISHRSERLDYEGKWGFIADMLHAKYPHDFPSWFDEYGRRRLFWYNNVLETYEEGYERMIEEAMNELSDRFDDDDLRYEAERVVDEKIESLPVFVIGEEA